MTTWRDAPDASGLWWVRREGQPDDVLRVDIDADDVWINRGGEGWCSVAEYVGAQWCRVVTPDTHAEIVRERDHYRERAAEHHRRGDEARHEAATLRDRVAALESTLREACETWRSRDGARRVALGAAGEGAVDGSGDQGGEHGGSVADPGGPWRRASDPRPSRV